MTIDDMIRETQTTLGLEPDGHAGPATWTAIHRALVKPPAATAGLADGIAPADPRSEAVIATLLPEVRPYARALVERAHQAGITIKVISGLRTYAEQDALFAQGRTAGGHVVTNARGGESNHNFGIAFDIGVFEGGVYLDSSPKYKAVGVLGQQLGLEWGGNWTTIHDEPHFQLRPGWAKGISESAMLARLRTLHDDGASVDA